MFRTRNTTLAGLLTLLLGMPTVQAIQPEADSGSHKAATRKLPSRPFAAPQLEALPSLRLDAQRDTLLQARMAPFRQRYGGVWEMRWDDRADRPNLVQGSGIALIPGRGNTLSPQQFGLAREADINLGTVSALAREFVDSVPELLQTRGLELKLDADRSVSSGGDRPAWFIEFGQYHEGVRVDGAFVYVRIAQGNIVQFGSERVAEVRVDTQPATTREAAFEQAWKELGFPAGTKVDEMVEAGELRIYPVLPAGDVAGEKFRGMAGLGYGHVLAWRYVFRLPDDDATWQVLVDAHSNRVLQVDDLTVNIAATVSGGIYPITNTDAEVVVDLPFVAVTNGGSKVTDALGIYDYAGGAATTKLDGKYFRMADNCGSISLSNSTSGNLALGTSGGTDCTTPGVGGAGNTHASRSGFYHLTRINQKARTFLPTNSWLQGKVTANMNVNDTCNATWNGSAFNFYRSGRAASDSTVQCSNTGELAAVFLHEWGHGMDANSGGSPSGDRASGEALGDTFAFLETRNSCIGDNFRLGVNCHNCVACTGVRDVGDFGVSSPPAKRASPANLANDAGINCDRGACPYSTPSGSAYRGPMGYEGHCESLIASSANWDLAQALVTRFGDSGWARMDRIWYGSLTPAKSAYRVASGGTCNVNAQVDGCGSDNWYTVFLAVDDDDGNLDNGTPNACRIWDAYSAHGIACGTRPACSGDPPDFNLAVTTPPQTVCAAAGATFNLTVGSEVGFANPVTLAVSGNPAGTTPVFSPNPVTPGNPATLSLDTAGAAAGSSTLTISGTAAASPGHSATAQLTVVAAAPAAPALVAPADGSSGIDAGTAIALSWAAVAGVTGYTSEIATDTAFANIVTSRSNSPDTNWSVTGLQPGTRYYWRVRGANLCGNGTSSEVYSFRTTPLPGYCDENQTTNAVYGSDVEGSVSDWTASGTPTWAVSTARPSSGTKSWLAVDVASSSDQRLVSPAITLPTGQNPLTLSFQNDVNLEERAGGCRDGGFVEVSTNDGSTWTPVSAAQLLTTPYTGEINTGAGNGMQAWCGTLPYRRTVVDLDSYAGQAVRLRFRVSTSSSTGDTPLGWFVDDIKVQGCKAAVTDRIFDDYFEML